MSLRVLGAREQSMSSCGRSGGATGKALSLTTGLIYLASTFGLYWFSAFVLEARQATTHFGADSYVYTLLAQGVAVEGLTRFHPLTIAAGLAWMKITSPLTLWISPVHLLKAMFALVGAVGVWAATSAFCAAMLRRYAAIFGIIYAASTGVWYDSSIEESKIFTATMSALYIANYLRMRQSRTTSGAALLTAILFLACLNEIVCCFLVVIPVVDTVLQRGWDLRRARWIVLHSLAVPVAYVLLEFVINGLLVTAGAAPDRASHWQMLIHFVSSNEFRADTLYAFAIEWFFFNIASPKPDASFGAAPQLNFAGTFEPSLETYFSSPVSTALVALAAVILIATLWPRGRAQSTDSSRLALWWGLLAYALLRTVFFLVFLPGEPLLNSAAATLTDLLPIAIPFAASGFPGKRVMLALFALLLIINNGAFVFAQSSWLLSW